MIRLSIAAPTGWSTWNTDTGGQGAYENHELLTSTLGGNRGIYDGTYQMTLGNYITGLPGRACIRLSRDRWVD